MEPLEIQRLVDGELPPSELSLLLKRIDLAPENWRKVALALLEEQVFSKEIRHANLPQHLQATAATTPVKALDARDQTSLLTSFRNSGWKRFVLPATLAASVLLAIGITAVQPLLKDSRDELRSANAIAQYKGFPLIDDPVFIEPTDLNSTGGENDWGNPVGELRLASDDASFHSGDHSTTVEGQARSRAMNNRIPVYEVRADQAQRWMDDEARRMDSWREQLRQRGYKLDSKPNRIEKTLPDGRALIVPVNQWNVRPIGQ